MREARLLDELAVNATAATTAQIVEGWVLRASPGLPFQRSNSVAVLDDDAAALDRRLAVASEFARRHGVELLLQLSPDVHPRTDAELERRGFRAGPPTLVQTLPRMPAGGRAAPGLVVSVAERADPEWDGAYGHGDERTRAYSRMLARIGPRTGFVSARRGGEVAGVGFGVLERGWLGVYGMATLPHARRQGVAATVIAAMLDWARGGGASRAYLQVDEQNAPARALYTRLGFTTSHAYHYRRPG